LRNIGFFVSYPQLSPRLPPICRLSNHQGKPQKFLRIDVPLELRLAGETGHRVRFQPKGGNAELFILDYCRSGAAERIQHLVMEIQPEFGNVFPN